MLIGRYKYNYVQIISSREICKEVYNYLSSYVSENLKRNYTYNGGSVLKIPIEINSKQNDWLNQFQKEMNKLGHIMSTSYREENLYTPDELNYVEYFEMRTFLPLKKHGTNLEFYGTKFTRGCQNCRYGKAVIGDIFINKSIIKGCGIFEMDANYYCISADMQRFILEHNLT